MAQEQLLLRVTDLAPLLGVTVSRVYQLIRAGEIPSVRVGRAIRVPVEAWRQWLAEQTRRAMESARSLPETESEDSAPSQTG